MTVVQGGHLGPYEVLSPLGAGGMGEVWRARDTRLGREVALKILPEEVASNTARLRRFEKEARSASALNHPNIVTIFDTGTADSTSWIAMELVDGKTLRELLLSGPLPVKRLLSLSTQIADGLSRAHEAGIVHRDLKPENVMVTRDSLVKVLDFGLAKLMHSGPGDGEGSRLPTETGTSPGVVLGTVSYMSPEQACGHPVDFRSDQFSLGVMLYEMATGKRAFERANAPDTLSAILHDEPTPLTQATPHAPTPLAWVVERCLAKEPAERYASTKDLARDLANLRDRVSQGSSAAHLLVDSPARRRSWRWLAAAALLLAGAAIGVVGTRRPREEPPRYRRLTFRHGLVHNARFAPDGQTVIYGARWDGKPPQLFSTRTDSTETTLLPFTDASIFSISRSGTMALLMGGALAEASLAGGAARMRLEGVGAADWSPDGRNLAVVRGHRLELPIGKPLYEKPNGDLFSLRFSPDGTTIALFEGDFYDCSIILLNLEGKKRTLSRGWEQCSGLAWNPGTGEVWFSAREHSIESSGSLDLHAISPSGRHRVVSRAALHQVIQDISPSGRTLLAEAEVMSSITAFPADSKNGVDLTWLDFSSIMDLSEDGTVILFLNEGQVNGATGEVFLRRTDGSPPVRLGEGNPSALSSDGQWAVSVPPTRDRLLILPTGAGEARVLPESGLICRNLKWFPDGKSILLEANAPGRPPRIYVQNATGSVPRPMTPEGFEMGGDRPISPDGKLAAIRGPGGKIMLYPVAGGEPRDLPGATPEDEFGRWDSTGQSVFLKSGLVPQRIDRLDLATGRRELWREINLADPAGVMGIDTRLTADGKVYAYTCFRQLSNLFVVDGLK